MKWLNNIFFGEDEVCLHDFLWFYGGMIVMALIASTTIPSAIKLLLM